MAGLTRKRVIRRSPALWLGATRYPANTRQTSTTNSDVVNGEHFTTAQYTVLIEEQPFEAEQIRLKDLAGNVVGEFSIMQVEPLEAVCELRIWV